MNPREKRLLVLLLAAVFLVVNVAGVKLFLLPKLRDAREKETTLLAELDQMELDLDNQEEIQKDVEWLLKHEPEPLPSQKVESQLEQFANREAQRRGLTVKRRKIQPAIKHPVLAYSRARLELEVSGSEQALYQWLDRLRSPDDLRAVTMLRLYPKRDDDTLVDCQVTVEQWFVPEA